MKKKVLSLLLCVTMAASLFAGCKSAVESEEEDSAAEESADDEAEKGEKRPPEFRKTKSKLVLYMYRMQVIWAILTTMILEQKRCRKHLG